MNPTTTTRTCPSHERAPSAGRQLRRRAAAPILVGIALLAACDAADSLTAPADQLSDLVPVAAPAPPHAIGVLDWNAYVGADVDAVIMALANDDPSDDVPALLAGIETLQATDWPTRAVAIADQISLRRPHVIGLQEMTEIGIDLTALGLPIVIDQDFLATLTAELSARGLNYTVASVNTNIVANPIPGISVVDHDAILVDANRVSVLGAADASYAANIGVVAPGIELRRGWTLVDAEIGGTTYRFVNTHLESGPGAQLSGLRALQAQELAGVIGAAPRVVLMGDLNDGDTSPMYGVLAAAGMMDAWTTLRPGAAGLTCCHSADLSDTNAEFDQRIDFILTRGLATGPGGLEGRIDRLGDVPADRIQGPFYPIWPSDHAGLVVQLLVPPGQTQ